MVKNKRMVFFRKMKGDKKVRQTIEIRKSLRKSMDLYFGDSEWIKYFMDQREVNYGT
jgi:hypothetical protein